MWRPEDTSLGVTAVEGGLPITVDTKIVGPSALWGRSPLKTRRQQWPEWLPSNNHRLSLLRVSHSPTNPSAPKNAPPVC
jgi:hypothetical protein